eukprot:scaffold86797_cov53-Phaeocystis_antarctica.AAC.2
MVAGLLLSLERQMVGGPVICSGRPPSLCTPGSRQTTPPELTTACSESLVAMVWVQGGGGAKRTITLQRPRVRRSFASSRSFPPASLATANVTN